MGVKLLERLILRFAEPKYLGMTKEEFVAFYKSLESKDQAELELMVNHLSIRRRAQQASPSGLATK